jgi:hypothetical protein
LEELAELESYEQWLSASIEGASQESESSNGGEDEVSTETEVEE